MNAISVSNRNGCATRADGELSSASHQNHRQKERIFPLSMQSRTDADESIKNIGEIFSSEGTKHSLDFNSVTSISSGISVLREPTTRKSTRSRKVHFTLSSGSCNKNRRDVQLEIIPIVSLKNHREKSKIWYNQRDFSSMQDENNVVIKLLEMGYNDETFVQNTTACLRGPSRDSLVMTARGLERQTKTGFSKYLNARSMSLDAVLRKQRLEQDNLPSVRAEEIAATYQSETAMALKESLERARLDAIWAREYLQSGDCDITTISRLQALEKATSKSSSIVNRNIFRRQRVLSISS